MELERKDGLRSCLRGMGPSAQCSAFSPKEVADCKVLEGTGCAPFMIKEAVLLACWWALREIEAGTIRIKQVDWQAAAGGSVG